MNYEEEDRPDVYASRVFSAKAKVGEDPKAIGAEIERERAEERKEFEAAKTKNLIAELRKRAENQPPTAAALLTGAAQVLEELL